MQGDESLAEYAKWTKDESDKARALPSARLDIQSGSTFFLFYFKEETFIDICMCCVA